MQFSSIQPIDRALSYATIPSLSGPGSNGNEGVLCIPQNSSITGTSPSDYLVSYPGHSLGEFYSSTRLGNHTALYISPSSAARISLTLSRHSSLLFIAFGRSSGLHPVSSQSCCMDVRVGRPAFVRSNKGVHRSTSLMSSSLRLQQCPACLVCLTWIVFVMRGKWPYSWCFVGYCLHDLFNVARSIFV